MANAEANPENESEIFVSRVRFIPAEDLEPNTKVTVEVSEAICSYAGVQVAENTSAVCEVKEKLERILVEDAVVMKTGESKELTIQVTPAVLAEGMKVKIQSEADIICSANKQEVVLDAEGKATIQLDGMVQGQTVLTFTLDGADLTAKTRVVVLQPEILDILIGDIDNNGEIALSDLMSCLRHVSGSSLLEGDAMQAADIDGNGAVELSDLMRLLRFISGSSTEL